MGQVKNKLQELKEKIEELMLNGLDEQDIDIEMATNLSEEEWELYEDNKDDIFLDIETDLQKIEDSEENPKIEVDGKRDDGSWTDPAGGVHDENDDDPAHMYEDLEVPSIFRLNEGKRTQSLSHPLDDLKSDFRSWETEDHCNRKDTEELFGILQDRHPDFTDKQLWDYACGWTGYDEDDPSSLDEGCNCGGKRPRPKIKTKNTIRRPGTKLHENLDEEFIMTEFFKKKE